ncbi:MAG TPA: hypothetical protein VIG67_08655 [Yaniella sp.]
MTTTLLRHELIRTKKPLLIIGGIAIVLIVLADLLALLTGAVGIVFAVLVTLIVVPAVQLYFVIDFYRSCYGSGAILTHSLPIPGRQLFWTKLLFALLVTVLASVFATLVLFVQGQFVLEMANLTLAQVYQEVQQVFRQLSGLGPLVVMSVLWVVVMPLASMYSSVVIGSGGWARRLSIGGPIIVFMCYYVLMQLLGFASVFVPPVFDVVDGRILGTSLWQSAMGNADTPLLPVSMLIAHVVVIAALLVWASRDMQHKVELR